MSTDMYQKRKERKNKPEENVESQKKMDINWFPGHMAKTRRLITESLSQVDAVAELVDARIPVSSRNPELAGIISDKPRIVLLNKCDIADANATAEWKQILEHEGALVLMLDCKSGKGINLFKNAVKDLLFERLERLRAKGMSGKSLRIMVVGIPNVGKSSFINRVAKITKAKVEDRPGVTRGNQWYSVDNELELLDTPGVLWPKFDDQTVGEHLAFTGAVRDSILDIETLAFRLTELLIANYNEMLCQRYKVEPVDDAYEMMLQIGKKRGMLMRGNEVDMERVAIMLLDEFRGGLIGRITIERPRG